MSQTKHKSGHNRQDGLPVTCRKFRMLDLFSGIGGFSLAATWVWGDALEIVAFCEIDKYCQAVLRKHWPSVPIIEDVRDVKAHVAYFYRGLSEVNANQEIQARRNSFDIISSGGRDQTIDILTGGFPCQPYSCAGKRKGKADDRALWPEMLRVISEVRPRWVIGENVAGIINMELDSVLSDLEGLSYETQAFVIPAASVGAPHRRDRVWIMAKSDAERRGWRQDDQGQGTSERDGNQAAGDVADTIRQGPQRSWWRSIGSWWWEREPFEVIQNARLRGWEENGLCIPESLLGRVAHGVPSRVDRLRALGNAIVPQVAEEIMRAIKAVEG